MTLSIACIAVAGSVFLFGAADQTGLILVVASAVLGLGFPLIAGWMIVELGILPLLQLVAFLAITEATLASRRAGFG